MVIYTGRVAIKRRDVETMTGGEVLSPRIFFFFKRLGSLFLPTKRMVKLVTWGDLAHFIS